MIILHHHYIRSVIGVAILLLSLSCARVTTQSGGQPPETSDTSEVTRSFQNISVTSVRPSVLSLEAGKSMGALITGSALSGARTLQGQRDKQAVQTIRGGVRCGRSPSCSITISTTSQTPAGDYQIALLDKNRRVMTYLPVNLTVTAKAPTARATISSIRPAKLVVEAGKSRDATIIGNGLRAAQIVEGRVGTTPYKSINGSVRCGAGRACVVTMSTASETAAGVYKIALLDKNRQFLTTLPVDLTVETREAAAPVIIDVDPAKLVVESGQALGVLITGTGLSAVQGAEAQLQNRPVSAIQGRVSCPNDRECKLDLSTTSRAQEGRYQIVLLDLSGRRLATLPTALMVTVKVVKPPPKELVGVIPVNGDPNISASRSCQDPSNTDVVLLSQPGNRFAVDAELAFLRAASEYCPSANTGMYHLRFCLTGDGCSSGPGYEVEFGPEDSELPQRFAFQVDQAMWTTVGEALSVGEGDTIYWQVSLRAGTAPTAPPISFSSTRPLIYMAEAFVSVCAPGTPPQLWSPLPYQRIHATNRSFYWCDDTSANSWKVCWSRPGTTACNYEHVTTTNYVTGLSYYEFDQWGLIGGEMDWKVKACNDSAGQQCGAYSEPWRAKVPLAPARPIQPGHNASGQNIPDVPVATTFQWEPVNGAETYRFRLSHTQSQPFRVDQFIHETTVYAYELETEDLQNPNDPGAAGRFLDGGVSSWEVAACYTASDGDPVCSDHLFALDPNDVLAKVRFVGAAQVNFADDLAPVFRSASCVNCHTVAAETNDDGTFRVGGDGTNGLPAANWASPPTYTNHPANLTAATNCQGCHGATLNDVKAQTTTLDIAWQAAPMTPVNMDFRNLSNAQLCVRAQDAGSLDDPNDLDAQAKLTALRTALGEPNLHPTIAHLAHDPLILWAVTGGPLPLGVARGTAVPAFGGTLEQWQDLVRNWVDNGMPCQ